MTIHEIRIFELHEGVLPDDFIHFFQGDGTNGLRAALRASEIRVPGMWRTHGRPKGANAEIVWIREFKNNEHKNAAVDRLYKSSLWLEHLKARSDKIVKNVETFDMTPVQAFELAKGPRDRGFHELRHYRLASNALPRMLAFFEDVRRLVGERGVRVLAWWCADYQNSERFLWLREFADFETKIRLSKEIYESELWLSKFKPRAMGVIEERVVRDLEPVAAARIGGHDPVDC
ncbi:MAG: hypothetical protein HY286_10845 [Planctomycetes bacterium]|nr:hypothetical protein [Planctomycetota bacterium]